MFTGIIEEVGEIVAVKRGQVSSRLSIRGEKIFDDLKIGDSVAVNGVCLTATVISEKVFEADVMAETLRRTNLGTFTNGTKVNLERAMAAGGRFGGHIVSGHIDGTGKITSMKREENAVWVRIDTAASILKYIIEKGVGGNRRHQSHGGGDRPGIFQGVCHPSYGRRDDTSCEAAGQHRQSRK